MLFLRYNAYFVSNILSCDNIFRIFKFSTSACKCLQFTNVFDFAFYFLLETEILWLIRLNNSYSKSLFSFHHRLKGMRYLNIKSSILFKHGSTIYDSTIVIFEKQSVTRFTMCPIDSGFLVEA